jgi:ATP-binding cassette, subfamily B, bacterial
MIRRHRPARRMRYANDIHHFRKDFYRALRLVWDAGKGLSFLNFILLLLQSVLPVISLYFIKLLIDLITGPHRGDFGEVEYAIIWFSAVQFLIASVGQLAIYINNIQVQKLSVHLSSGVLHKAVNVDMAYYENPDYHDTLHMAQQRAEYQAPILLNNLNGLILNSLSLLMLVLFFFRLQWSYAIIFVAVSIPLAFVKWYYGYRLFKLEKKYVALDREASYYHHMLTAVPFAKEVRSFGFGNAFINRYKHIRDIIYTEKDSVNKRFTMLSLIAQVVEVVIMVAVFLVLAGQAWAGLITIGVFVIYLQGFQRLQAASRNFLQSLVQIFQQRLFLRDIFTFFDLPHTLPAGTRPFPKASKGLEVSNISFTYPQTGREVLHNVSMSCAPGKIIAIVGENGSGKSTLVKLLAGLYAPPAGNITIDGVNINDISPTSLRDHTITLFQDFEEYFLTINENIALADNLDIRDADIRSAAAAAGADEFIDLLIDKYQTRLGRTFHGAQQLSGGQWQKLAIARAFYKSARLVILDEPTSNIDAVAEYDIFRHLREHTGDKMVILISHRMYNLKMADHIYVMRDGSIAEQGSYDELVNRQGIFRDMYNKQQL